MLSSINKCQDVQTRRLVLVFLSSMWPCRTDPLNPPFWPVYVSVSVSVPVLFLSETNSDAQWGGRQGDGDVATEKGGNETRGGAPKVSPPQTKGPSFRTEGLTRETLDVIKRVPVVFCCYFSVECCFFLKNLLFIVCPDDTRCCGAFLLFLLFHYFICYNVIS